jgi:hypothetical protein
MCSKKWLMPLVDRADLRQPAGGDRVGLVVALHEQELHAVGQGEDLRLDLLREGGRGDDGGDDGQGGGVESHGRGRLLAGFANKWLGSRELRNVS